MQDHGLVNAIGNLEILASLYYITGEGGQTMQNLSPGETGPKTTFNPENHVRRDTVDASDPHAFLSHPATERRITWWNANVKRLRYILSFFL